MNKVSVSIQGLEFSLRGEESAEHLREVGRQVDQRLGAMLSTNRKLSMSSAAILTLCNLVDEEIKEEARHKEELVLLKDREEKMEALTQTIGQLKAALHSKDEELKEKDAQFTQQLENALAHQKANLEGALEQKGQALQRKEQELTLLTQSVREYRDDNEQLSKLNKELKFELQSYKYKVLDLQNKLFEKQEDQVKDHREEHHANHR